MRHPMERYRVSQMGMAEQEVNNHNQYQLVDHPNNQNNLLQIKEDGDK